MRSNKKLIYVLVVLIIVFISLISWRQYTISSTEYVYGMIPKETVPEEYDNVKYTIPIIDEEGNRGTQTFTVDNNEEVGDLVKLHVRNDKVKKYEFITDEELPEAVKNNL